MTNKIRIDLEVAGRAKRELDRTTKSVDDLKISVDKAGFSFKRSFEVLTGVIGANALQAGISTLTRSVSNLAQTLVVDGVAAAQLQEDAINELNAALVRNGQFSQQTSQDLQNFASALQETTKFGDEVVLQSLALSQAFGFTAEQAKVATEAALELSVAAGISLDEATRRVGRTISGSVEDVSKFASEIKNLTREELAAGQAATVLLEALGGTAAAQIKTFSGATAQLSNTFGDFTEEIGFVITKNPAFIASVKTLNSIFQELGAIVKENRQTLIDFTADGLLTALNALGVTVRFVDGVISAFNVLKIAVNNAGQAIGDRFAFVAEVLRGNVSGAIDTFVERAKNRTKELSDALSKTFDGAPSESAQKFEAIILRLQESIVAARINTDAYKSSQDSVSESTNKANEALTEQQRLLGQQGQQLAGQLGKQTDEAKLQQELELIRAGNQEKIFEQESFLEREAELQSEFFELQQSKLNEALNQQLISQEQYSKATENLEAKQTKTVEELAKKRAIARQKALDTALGGASEFFGNLSSLQKTGEKDLFEIGKRAAQANAIVNVAQGVTKALATFPPPFNFAIAASVAAAGAVQIASIEAQSFGAQKGLTEVPPGFPNDTFPAKLTSGERVVDASTNQDLKRFLSSSEGIAQEIRSLREDVKNNSSRPIVVQVDGRTIFEVVEDQLDRGRAFA